MLVTLQYIRSVVKDCNDKQRKITIDHCYQQEDIFLRQSVNIKFLRGCKMEAKITLASGWTSSQNCTTASLYGNPTLRFKNDQKKKLH
jgi:hypothetical protein